MSDTTQNMRAHTASNLQTWFSQGLTKGVIAGCYSCNIFNKITWNWVHTSDLQYRFVLKLKRADFSYEQDDIT